MSNNSIFKQLLNKEPQKKEILDMIKKQYLEFSRHWKENVDKVVDEDSIAEIREEIKDQFQIIFNKDDVKMLLNLYPKFRIDVAVYGLSDTPTRELLSDCIMDYFLQCPHPTYGDDLPDEELAELYNLLRSQAKQLNFITE